ncbi:unnamed protein product [Nippostrongylus brasiliensis]|uniref:Protein-tyrosine phosphatase n=1 Tax=Nippostrongylus brasiliensis TaxID=27835 RepID=A0A0N4XCI6_NIPBR|nr:unnamed protein product [Nippostrongylus brasiliensis]
MEKGVHGLKKEFASLKRVNNFAIMRTFVANNALGRNRYKDVGCLDATRVRLTYNDGNDYIHANYVGTPSNSRRFICTQAPLDKTCRDFWMMCIQNRVEFIVMLCDLVEKGAKKCCQYYPMRGSISFGDITIAIVDSKLVKCESSVIDAIHYYDEYPSEYLISNRGTARSSSKRFSSPKSFFQKDPVTVLRVRHIHWVDWPDRGVPPADTAIIQVLEIMRDTQSPIVVHCSAGVGRTGSMVLIQYILESIGLEDPIESCDQILLKIRSQRANTIQVS